MRCSCTVQLFEAAISPLIFSSTDFIKIGAFRFVFARYSAERLMLSRKAVGWCVLYSAVWMKILAPVKASVGTKVRILVTMNKICSSFNQPGAHIVGNNCLLTAGSWLLFQYSTCLFLASCSLSLFPTTSLQLSGLLDEFESDVFACSIAGSKSQPARWKLTVSWSPR